MDKLKPELLAADTVVFVTPLYYFGMSAQIKTVIDRFYGINYRLMGSGKRAMLMATAYDDRDDTMTDLVAHFRTIVKYLKRHDAGILLATGYGTRRDIERTEYPERAYQMGRAVGQESR
jgi:multimeric flavodoxin WrbA